MRHTYFDRAPRMLVGLVVFSLLLIWPAFVHGQDTLYTDTVSSLDSIPTAAIYATVTDSARATLEQAWDDTTATQHERAYCVTNYTQEGVRDGRGVNVLVEVFAVAPAHMDSSGVGFAAFTCPPGEPELHTHPPASCYETCHIGGLEANECFPSRNDLIRLIYRRDDWAIVQCDRHAFRFFYPFELRLLPKQTMRAQTLRHGGGL